MTTIVRVGWDPSSLRILNRPAFSGSYQFVDFMNSAWSAQSLSADIVDGSRDGYR
jgi:hypothetical protein